MYSVIQRLQVTLVAILAAMVAIAPGCDRKPESAKQASSSTSGKVTGSHQTLPLRMAQLPISYSALSFLAESRGFNSQAGLQYTSVSVPAGPDVVTSLRSQSPDSAVVGTIAFTPVATMVGAGDAPVVIVTMMSSNRQAKLVTFETTGITVDPTTLRGKRIGVTRNTNGDIYLSRLLARGGLSERDVILVGGRPADLRASLVRGDLDAAVLWDPFVVQAKREYQRLRSESKTPDRGAALDFVDPQLHTLAFNVVSTREKLNANRSSIERLVRGLIFAEGELRRDPIAAQASVEGWLGLESGDLTEFFATSEFRVHLDLAKGPKWLGEELEWLGSRDPSVVIPSDLTTFFDSSVLESIDSSRVVRNP
jgi:ABC-type nitrate/sulfonate/bicarbonate transport system substrate-binding protein